MTCDVEFTTTAADDLDRLDTTVADRVIAKLGSRSRWGLGSLPGLPREAGLGAHLPKTRYRAAVFDSTKIAFVGVQKVGNGPSRSILDAYVSPERGEQQGYDAPDKIP